MQIEAVQHNLPLPTASFIGREDEVLKIQDLLKDPRCRLLTLVGPGGIGKTSLALEVARQALKPGAWRNPVTTYADGVFLVDLEPVAAPDDIAIAVAREVGHQHYEASDPEGQLLRFLAAKQMLLILDGFEHLLAGVSFVEELLGQAPGIALLATSRTALNLRQEWLYQVEGMACPDDSKGRDLHLYDSLQLFLERAQQARHDFSLEEEGAQAVDICQLVEGSPLGIELAAAWLRRLSSDDIVRELQCGLDILESVAHDLPQRHRSMRAVFDHSWRLLDQEERRVLMMLSVFRGSFRREAAEQVIGASLQTLASLLDQSLIRLGGNGRYSIHELQRQYAAEKLASSSELERAARDGHCTYFADVAQQVVRRTTWQVMWGRENESQPQVDIDNIGAAWRWAVQNGRIGDLGQCMELMFRYWFRHARMEEAEASLTLALAAIRGTEASPHRDVTLGLALANLGFLDIMHGRLVQAQEKVRESLSLLRGHDASRELALATSRLAMAFIETRSQPEEARRLGVEAVGLLEETEQLDLLLSAVDFLGWLSECRAQLDEGERLFRQELRLARRIGFQASIAQALMSLGSCARRRGDYTKAERYLQESMALESSEFTRIIACTLMGYVCEATGALEQAESHFREGLAGAEAIGNGLRIAHCTVALGHFYSGQGQHARASELYQEVLQLGPSEWTLGYRLQALTGLGRIAATKEAHEEARQLFEESLGMCRRIEDRRYAIHNLNGLARLALAQSQLVRARQHLQAALEEATGTGLTPRTLDTLLIAGELFSQEGDLTLAARLATLVQGHAASHYWTKQQAEPLLVRLEVEMTTESFEAACRQGASDVLQTVAEAVAARLAHGGPLPSDRLSERELEVLRLVARGCSNQQIATELVLALGTVKSHLYHVYQKLGVSSRTEAIARSRDLYLL